MVAVPDQTEKVEETQRKNCLVSQQEVLQCWVGNVLAQEELYLQASLDGVGPLEVEFVWIEVCFLQSKEFSQVPGEGFH